MSEFERARQRAERRLGVPLTEYVSKPVEVPAICKPVKQKGRNNEIEVRLFINGDEFNFSFKAKLAGNLMASQLTEKNLRPIVASALLSKFSGVE